MTFYINDCHNLKAGASLTTQNIHGIRSTMTTFPFDRYALTSSNVRSERTALYSFGYSGMVPDGGWDWSAEIYYKSMRNVYDYLDGMTMLSRINLESIITGGKGRSYGMELMLRKNTGRLNGWVSYTLSQTQTRINDINGSRGMTRAMTAATTLPSSPFTTFRTPGNSPVRGRSLPDAPSPLPMPNMRLAERPAIIILPAILTRHWHHTVSTSPSLTPASDAMPLLYGVSESSMPTLITHLL